MKALSIITLFALFAIPHTADAGCRGCGCRGGPGWRKANGQCASWADGGGGGYTYTPTTTTYVPAVATKVVAAPKKKKTPPPKYEWGAQYSYTMIHPTTNKWVQFREYKFFQGGDKEKEVRHTLGTFGDWTCYLEFSRLYVDSLPDTDQQYVTFGCENKNGAKTHAVTSESFVKPNSLGMDEGPFGGREEFYLDTETRNHISIVVVSCDDRTVECNAFKTLGERWNGKYLSLDR